MKTSGREITKAILSRECPFCEAAKLDGHCFCNACYATLPKGIQDRIKNGLRSLSTAIKDGIQFLETPRSKQNGS